MGQGSTDQKILVPPPLVRVPEVPEDDGKLTSPPSFEAIFRDHAPFLWRTLRGLGVPDADAEDLCQEALLVVHRKLPEFQGTRIRSWIYGICLRVASDYRRSARVRREKPTDVLPEESAPSSVVEDIDARRTEARLIQALDQLDEHQRAVFVLFEIEQLTLKEIAEATECPLQTAYSRLQAARTHVRSAMQRAKESDGRA